MEAGVRTGDLVWAPALVVGNSAHDRPISGGKTISNNTILQIGILSVDSPHGKEP
jgi:hypothetical protein